MRVANCVHTSSAFAIYAAFFFDPGGRPGPRRRPRRRRTVFAFGAAGVTTAFFVCAIFSATAFGGDRDHRGATCHESYDGDGDHSSASWSVSKCRRATTG